MTLVTGGCDLGESMMRRSGGVTRYACSDWVCVRSTGASCAPPHGSTTYGRIRVENARGSIRELVQRRLGSSRVPTRSSDSGWPKWGLGRRIAEPVDPRSVAGGDACGRSSVGERGCGTALRPRIIARDSCNLALTGVPSGAIAIGPGTGKWGSLGRPLDNGAQHRESAHRDPRRPPRPARGTGRATRDADAGPRGLNLTTR